MTTVFEAPGVVKLYGEHASVYGRKAVGAAIGKHARAIISENRLAALGRKAEESRGYHSTIEVSAMVAEHAKALSENGWRDRLKINLPDIKIGGVKGVAYDVDKEMLLELHRRCEDAKVKQDMKPYLEYGAAVGIPESILPFATMAATLNSYKVDVFGMAATVATNMNVGRGYASSAACANAFVGAFMENSGFKTSEQSSDTLINIARDGERVVHKSVGAGTIDGSTSRLGGIVSVVTPEIGGVKRLIPRKEPIGMDLQLILIDTGEKEPTHVPVGHIRKQYDDPRTHDWTVRHIDEIHECSGRGIEALMRGSLVDAGHEMNVDHELLRLLGVSSPRLETAIGAARAAGCAGAKLSGGGRGGLAIAIAEDPEKVAEAVRGVDIKPAFITEVLGVAPRGAELVEAW